MGLFGSKEEELLSSLSEQIAERVQASNSSVKPLLKRFVYSRAKQNILALHPNWTNKGVLGPDSLDHLAEQGVIIDLSYFPKKLSLIHI